MISGIGSGSYMDTIQMVNMRDQMKNPFDEIDTDGDGVLSKAEISSLTEKVSETSEQSLDAGDMFSNLDADGDGQITEEEFQAAQPLGPPPGMMGGMQAGGTDSSDEEDSSGYIDPLDTNEDGIVDAEEAQAGMTGLIQAYLSQTRDGSGETNGSGGQLNLLG